MHIWCKFHCKLRWKSGFLGGFHGFSMLVITTQGLQSFSKIFFLSDFFSFIQCLLSSSSSVPLASFPKSILIVWTLSMKKVIFDYMRPKIDISIFVRKKMSKWTFSSPFGHERLLGCE